MEARLLRLEERTEHIQRDVAEIKGDLRRLNDKLDSKLDGVKKTLAALMEKNSSMQISMIRWMIGTVITAVTLAFAVARFLSWPNAQQLIGGGA